MTELALVLNIAAYSAQVLCLVAGAALVVAVVRIDVPAVKYVIWRGLAAVCLLLPWLTDTRVTPAAASAGLDSTSGVTFSAIPLAMVSATPESPGAWPRVLLLVLITGGCVRVAWLMVGLFRLHRLRRAGVRASLPDDLETLRATLAPRAEVREVEELRQPVTFGLLRPVVLLPGALSAQDMDHRRAVLCHELVHARRGDWAWAIAEELFRAALWFHPAAWWLVSRIQLTREEVVDRLAVQITGSRRAYIEALMLFAEDAPLARATAFARRRHLFTRILLVSEEKVMSIKRLAVSSGLIALTVPALVWYGSQAFPLAAAPFEALLPEVARPEQLRANGSPTPQPALPLAVTYPAEAAALDAVGVVVLKLSVNSGRVTEAAVTSFALHTSSPSTYKAVDDEPLPPVELAFPDDQPRQAAAQGFIKAALAGVRTWAYEPNASSPQPFYVMVMMSKVGATTFLSPTPIALPAVDPARLAFSSGVSVATSRSSDSPASNAAAGQSSARTPQVQGGAPGPSREGLAAGTPTPTAPTPAGATQTTPAPLMPIRVGGNIAAPRKVKDVKPAYPQEALTERKEGIVILEATIGPDGLVRDARVLRSMPGLDEAAVAAVKQWEFTPTLLNGVPVAIIMSVTVNFTLK